MSDAKAMMINDAVCQRCGDFLEGERRICERCERAMVKAEPLWAANAAGLGLASTVLITTLLALEPPVPLSLPIRVIVWLLPTWFALAACLLWHKSRDQKQYEPFLPWIVVLLWVGAQLGVWGWYLSDSGTFQNRRMLMYALHDGLTLTVFIHIIAAFIGSLIVPKASFVRCARSLIPFFLVALAGGLIGATVLMCGFLSLGTDTFSWKYFWGFNVVGIKVGLMAAGLYRCAWGLVWDHCLPVLEPSPKITEHKPQETGKHSHEE